MPPPGLRTALSLALFIHLCGLAIAVLSNAGPVSPLRARLGMVPIVRQYYQLLHLFLGYNYQLTDAATLDGDLWIEVETDWSGTTRPEAKMLRLAAAGPDAGLTKHQYRGLLDGTGSRIAELSGGDTESIEGLLPKAIAAKLLAEAGINSGKHRVRLRTRQLLSMDDVRSPDRSLRDPLAPSRLLTLYEADVTFAGGELVLTKAASALETSPVNRRPR
jgi:hypothetical protein